MSTFIKLNIAVCRGQVDDWNAQLFTAANIEEAAQKLSEDLVEDAIDLESHWDQANNCMVNATREDVVDLDGDFAAVHGEEESEWIIAAPAVMPEMLYLGFPHSDTGVTTWTKDEFPFDELEFEVEPECSINIAQDADYTYFVISTADMETL